MTGFDSRAFQSAGVKQHFWVMAASSVVLQSILLFPNTLGNYGPFFLLVASVGVFLFFVTSLKNAIILLPLFLYLPFSITPGIQLSELSVAILFVMTVFNLLLPHEPIRYQTPFWGCVLLILLSEFLSLVNAKYAVAGIKHIVRMVEGFVFIFYLVINFVRTKETITAILYNIVAAGFLASLHGIIQFISGSGNTIGAEGRIFGLQGGGYGAFVGASLICLISILANKSSGAKKILLASAIPVYLIALVFHQTRAWYGSIAVAVVFLMFQAERKKRWRLFVFAALSLGIALGILFYTNLFNIIPQSKISVVEKTSFQLGLSAEQSAGTGKFISGLSRLYIWWKGFGFFKMHPLLGYGIANLRFKNMFTGQLGDPDVPYHGFIDSQYLNILYETGILGLAVWIVFLYYLIRASRLLLSLSSDDEWKTISQAITGSLIVFFVGGIFWCITVTHEMIAILGYLSGLLFAGIRIRKEANQEEPNP